MTHDEAFLRDIRAHPDDDAPPLVYADWLEEHGDADRVEFIRMRCRRARLRDGDPAAEDMDERAVRLLEAHWDEWLDPLRALVGPNASRRGEAWLVAGPNREALHRLPRGFVERITLHAATFVRRGGELLAVAPVRRLHLWAAGGVADKLADCPHLEGMATLRFVDYYQEPLTADGARALAGSPHLGGLCELDLSHNYVGEAGVAALLRAKWLPGLRVLLLSDCGLGDGAAAELAACSALAHLEELDLVKNHFSDRGRRALRASPHLRRLRVLTAARDSGAWLLRAPSRSEPEA
jgi:uncharacterized protein (TIGR02996 family)